MGMKFLEKKVMENRFFGSNHIGRNDAGGLFVFPFGFLLLQSLVNADNIVLS
jgi:hypothetical protein